MDFKHFHTKEVKYNGEMKRVFVKNNDIQMLL